MIGPRVVRAAGRLMRAAGVAASARGSRRDDEPVEGSLGRGVALRGTVWPGGAVEPYDGVVLIAPDGIIDRIGPPGWIPIPVGVRVIGAGHNWVGPGIVDAHVHLAFGPAEEALRGGVVGVRDLGSPRRDALRRRTGHRRPPARSPYVGVAGPILTATGGYPSQSWGADGFASFLTTPAQARLAVRGLAGDGVDLVKVAVERGPDGAWPVPSTALLRAVVEAAHGAGLKVVAHALTVEAVGRVLDAGVDELAHTPVEPLPEALVDRVAAAGIPVVSTLQTFFSGGSGRAAARQRGRAAPGRRAAGLRHRSRQRRHPDRGRPAGAGPARRRRARPARRAAGGDRGQRRGGRDAAADRAAGAGPARRRRCCCNGDPLVEPGVWRVPRAVVCDGRLVEPPEGRA